MQKEKDDEWVRQEIDPEPIPDIEEPTKGQVLATLNFKPQNFYKGYPIIYRRHINFFRDRLGLNIIDKIDFKKSLPSLAYGFYWQQCYEYAREKGWLDE